VAKENRANLRTSKGQPEVPGSAGVYRIHRKTASLIGRAREYFCI
jgi:hypothetical protein